MSELAFDPSNIDVKSCLAEYLPSLLELMGDRPFGWAAVNRQFIEHRVEHHKKMMANGGSLETDINFYDVIEQYVAGNQKYKPLYIYFDNLLVELGRNVPPKKKELLSSTFRHLLTSFNLNFFHFIGELSVLNGLLSKGFKLERVEEPMDHGKSADFTMKTPGGDSQRIEVVNIHLWSQETKSDEELVRFLQGKIIDKINDKAKEDIANLIFFTIPVVWGPIEMLKRVRDLYETHLNMYQVKVSEPVAYVSTYYGESTTPSFGALSSLLLE